MEDIDIFEQVSGLVSLPGETIGYTVTGAIDQVASNSGLTNGQVKAAYYREKKLREQLATENDVRIDSKPPVSDPKPLRDGTEGDSIEDQLVALHGLLKEFETRFYKLLRDVQLIEVEQAGTKNLSRIARQLGMDK